MSGNLTELTYFIGEGTMRLGISITPLVIFICLNFQLSFSQTSFGDGRGNGQFKGRPCDDTEYRDYKGSPNWKNYGGWLSECDSLASAYSDSTFAIVLEERHRKKLEEERKRQEEIDNIDTELDMDAMWENTIWEEIVEIGEERIYEVENITAVAGVRGAEAEDEALALLYYRRSMKGLSKLDLQKALGKLIIKRQKMSDDSDTKKIDGFISQLKYKLKST
jgi:hypothetical protein